MGKYKGISMREVCGVLENARKAGFEEIQLNYIAGIDPLDACEQGFSSLSRLGLVDSVRLITLVTFSEDEARIEGGEALAE